MSTITLRNNTNEVVRLAIFKTPVLNPTLGTIAWQVCAPPPGGQQTIQIPDDFSVFAQYSSDPSNPSNLNCETAHVPFAETTAAFSIDSVSSQDRLATGAVINQQFNGLVLNEVRITNNYGLGALTTIAANGDAIYPPQVIWPGGLFIEDVRGTYYVAVVAQFTRKGDRLVQEEFSQTQTAVLEGGVLTVTGSMWNGYSLSAA
ncbi:hypothetical protein C7S18_17670 [Ahniella affigens]|uniref:Uncharacterized protein n=1 Tax=Ahniella affigens TaxID=2021234 RepID=A0A2P1PVT4_9GAMM|nr:hypothetical protein [Ahniella affigens]AVP98894.1 hypothetical protein C7S18_17670 [Ahniella affigens]